MQHKKLFELKLKSKLTNVLIAFMIIALATPLITHGSSQVTSNFLSTAYALDNLSEDKFTLIVLPDTQGYVKYYPWILDNQTRWIVDNKEALNIQFVIQLGDLVDNPDNLTQWESANRSMSILEGNVAWAVLPGNHDMFNGNLTNYNTYFGYDRFSDESWFGGAYRMDDNSNSYQLFSAGGDDYLILLLQYNPGDDVLSWANNVINAYPDRRVIVATHDYLMGFARVGQRSDIGERIWHSLVKPHADQLFLVLCGHSGAEDLITDKVNGHTIYQMLADYQNASNVESGWLRLLEFSPHQETIFVKTYSPLLNMYKDGSQSEFNIDYKTEYVLPVKLEGTTNEEDTIYIRSDGSIDPPKSSITFNGEIYTFRGDISGSIIIERDNVVIDGAGYTLRGTGAKDFRPSVEAIDPERLSEPDYLLSRGQPPDSYLTPESNNTGIYSYAKGLIIKNLKITDFWCAIELEYTEDNTITQNYIQGNNQGIWIHFSSNDNISSNTISDNKKGITLATAYDNILDNIIQNNSEYGIKISWSFNNISENDISSNGYGVSFEESSHNVLRGNSFSKNKRVFFNSWSLFPNNIQDIDDSNLVDGKPVYCWINKQDMTVPADAGWIALINSTSMKIENLNLSLGQEILLISTNNTTVAENILGNNDVCIYLEKASNNTVIKNTLTDSYIGIQIKDSSNNLVSSNKITATNQGIFLDSSSENAIQKNEVTANKLGIELVASKQNIVSGNIINSNKQGIHFGGRGRSASSFINDTIIYDSTNNVILRNLMGDNDCGVWISLSSHNIFSSNNFVNNTMQVKVEDPSFAQYNSVNSWDDGKAGNYWSDYRGKYSQATEVAADIWDTQYIIDENNADHYPLINQITERQSDTFPFIWVITATLAVAALGAFLFIYFLKFRTVNAKESQKTFNSISGREVFNYSILNSATYSRRVVSTTYSLSHSTHHIIVRLIFQGLVRLAEGILEKLRI